MSSFATPSPETLARRRRQRIRQRIRRQGLRAAARLYSAYRAVSDLLDTLEGLGEDERAQLGDELGEEFPKDLHGILWQLNVAESFVSTPLPADSSWTEDLP